MKSLSVRLGVILIGLLILGDAEAWGADWKFIKSDDFSSSYYDAQNIIRPSKNIIRVWIKREFTEEYKRKIKGKHGKEFENSDNDMILLEINCLEKKSRCLSLTVYDNKGKLIWSSSSQTKWELIIPESNSEVIYKAVCK